MILNLQPTLLVVSELLASWQDRQCKASHISLLAGAELRLVPFIRLQRVSLLQQLSCWQLRAAELRRFTSDAHCKEMFTGASGIVVTTYSMIAYSGKRSEESNKVMEAIAGREWGLLLLDEVHVVPAQMFRKVRA